MQELFSPCGLCSNLTGIRSKMPDSTSRLLMMEALTSATSAKGALKIQIDFTKPDKTGEVISLALTLQEVILSGYGLSGTTRGGEPSEQLTLNFTKIAYNSIESPAHTSPNMGWRHTNP
jgi:hypothetical protein